MNANWSDIRSRFPDKWLLLEAVKAHSEESSRIVEELDVLDTFNDSGTALQSYRRLHQESPQRELYVFHTSRESLNVPERRWLGVRASR